VLENFRRVCQGKYGLDPVHYYSAPGLSWDALLKKTGVKLELLTDLDMHLFIERGMRGGISMVGKRYAKANNPLVEGYNPAEPTNYITYLDANNFYGWAISLPLPKSGFHWKCVMPREEQIMKMKWMRRMPGSWRWTSNTPKSFTMHIIAIRWHQRKRQETRGRCQNTSRD